MRSCVHAQTVALLISSKYGSKVTVGHVVPNTFLHPELKAYYQLPQCIVEKVKKCT
ncbi:MAG: hypothetical protein IAX21_04965 [Candidatus Bathyarchaeota archaeon]|nr:hypothetical protein [Candidatus Bathyarchaeum tardum]WGM89700.1 MAG: hypothetical protein NUK63_00820 [Candidatus Bathyarchaeum tardum]WNZ30202.1 MAG: hypothetical protein IAX21_04965 [Candidatus Bathyarchaeota archaeon]